MSTSIPDSPFQGEEAGFHSRDSEVVVSEGPGDTTVQPARPRLLQLALAEQERLARLQEKMNQAPSADEPPIELENNSVRESKKDKP